MRSFLKLTTIFIIFIVVTMVLTSQTVTTTSQKKSKTVRVSADYVEPKKDVIYFRGKIIVTIEEDKVNLKTSEMYVRKSGDKWKSIEIPVKVEFTFDGGSAIAEKMTYDIDNKTGNLTNSTVTITDTKSNEKITVISETLSFDLTNDKYSGSKKGGVTITKGDITAVADRFDYDKKVGQLSLYGSVIINDPQKGIKMTASDAVINTETNDMKANNVSIELKVD
uniref:Organic solvent tolerance protein OstA n=2 Tax=Fervidobacterium pennivorans TaxID=93466 RepID=A0A7V4KDF8_FERPE